MVSSAISKQEGFISIVAAKDNSDNKCINITVKFRTWADIYNWAETQVHDELVDQLDPYRIKAWQAAKIEKDNEQAISPSEIVWETITPTYIIYE